MNLLRGGLIVMLATGIVNAADPADPPQFLAAPDAAHAVSTRAVTMVSSLAVTPGGRMWATWYAGITPGEDRNNYVVLSTSGDGGETWREVLIADPDGSGPMRAFDPNIWMAPDGALYWFWAQGTGGRDCPSKVWTLKITNPETADPEYAEPKVATDGVMMCKPLVLSTGEWALPASKWHSMEDSAQCVVSTNAGATWEVRGACHIPAEHINVDEHMFIERNDGSIWLLARTKYGIGESISLDRGRTWPELQPSGIPHPAARFFIRRLPSGNLLMVKHGPMDQRTGRSHLMAFISTDDGKTWGGGLLLDERNGISYPDGQQSADGTIWITYDYDRTGARQILMAAFREEDVAAGKPVTDAVKLRQIISEPPARPGDIKNGGFESGTGTNYNGTDDWFNFAGPATQPARSTGHWARTGTYGGSVSKNANGFVHPAVDTGHTIAADDTFSLTFWHKGHPTATYWTTDTDKFVVTLYSASGDIWSAEVFPTGGTWNEFSTTGISAANIGETLFLRFENPNVENKLNVYGQLDDVTLTVSSEPASFALAITPATAPATGFDLEWQSQAGKLYNLRTSTDLASPIAGWDLVEGDIVATPPTNVENVDPADPRRFYAVEEFAAPPPPPLLEEDFESDNSGFTTSVTAGTAWEWGDPDSTGFGGTVSAGNDGSTNCWGTGIGNPGFYANPTTNSRLISPAIDLTSVATAELSFAHAIDLDTGDSAVVRIFNTDTNEEIVAGDFPLTVSDANLSAALWATSGPHALPVGAPIRIEWILSGTGGATQDFMGWYIDDVVVTETTP